MHLLVHQIYTRYKIYVTTVSGRSKAKALLQNVSLKVKLKLPISLFKELVAQTGFEPVE